MLILLIFQDLRLVTYTLLFDFIIARVIDLIGEGGYAGKGFMIITPVSYTHLDVYKRQGLDASP